jgi:predicted Zn finger-like uncharacterized protein
MIQLTCPHCGYSKEIPADRLPTKVTRVKCPKCLKPFPLKPETTHSKNTAEKRNDEIVIACPHCDAKLNVSRSKVPCRIATVLCKQCKQDFTFDGEQLLGHKTPSTSDPRTDSPEADSTGPQSRQRLATLGDLFTRTWDVFRRRILTLIGINLVAVVLTATAYFLMGYGVELLQEIAGDTPAVMLIAGVVLFGLSMLIMTAILAAMIYAVVNEELGVKQALGYGIKNSKSFFWVFFLLGFFLVGGSLTFFIPGLLFMVWFVFAQFILAHDNIRGMDALLMSRAYVRGHSWGVFGRMLLIGMLGSLVSAIPIVGLVASLFLGPYTLIFYHEIFRDLREIKENVEYSGSRGTKVKWLLAGAAGYLIVPLITVSLLGPSLFQGLDLLSNQAGLKSPTSLINPSPAKRGKQTSSGAELKLKQTKFAPKAPIILEFQIPEGLSAGAWVGLYTAGSNNKNYKNYNYLPQSERGELNFRAPQEPGKYEFRLFLNWPDRGYEESANSQQFTVGTSDETNRSAAIPRQQQLVTSETDIIHIPMTKDNSGEVMIYLYAMNYTGSLRLNDQEIYLIKGERDMSYNFSSSSALKPGINTFELDYKTLPDDPWMTKVQLKISRYNWDTKQEKVFADWTYEDTGANREFQVVLDK